MKCPIKMSDISIVDILSLHGHAGSPRFPSVYRVGCPIKCPTFPGMSDILRSLDIPGNVRHLVKMSDIMSDKLSDILEEMFDISVDMSDISDDMSDISEEMSDILKKCPTFYWTSRKCPTSREMSDISRNVR